VLQVDNEVWRKMWPRFPWLKEWVQGDIGKL